MQPHLRRNQPGSSWISINNWHSLSPERRVLKRHKVTPAGHLNHPDVYPQDPNQEEDKMDVERLKRGYHAIMPPMEYDSIIKNPRLGNQDELVKTAKWLMQIMQKKNEINVINLDKKRLKECTFQKFEPNTTAKSIQDFFFSFTTGRRELHQLARRFPIFAKKEDCMHSIYIYKVPIQRTLWFFKMMQFGLQNATGAQNKQKRSSVDLYTSEQTKLFSKFIREFFRVCDNSTQLEFHQRWPYFICILKHAFEEGIVDKQDLLMDICDVATDYVAFPFEKPQIFRMLIIFLSQFVDVITQNAMLSRRVAYLIATRFKIYKRDYDRKKGETSTNVYSSECFADLVNCQHHRAVMMTMLGLMHAIIIDCPVALIWNPFESGDRTTGSPLDLLPCSPDVLVQHLPASCERIKELLRLRIDEIKQRSQNVEQRWMRSTNPQSGFDFIIDVCLNVISALDKVVLNAPNAFLRLYQQIFCTELGDKVSPQLIVRILIQWVVTTEREGTHRALVVCNLLRMRKRHYRSMAFGSRSLQDIFMEYLSNESPTPETSGANFAEEFRNLMHLFVELQNFQLFSHDAYIRSLMRCGQFTYQEPILLKILNYARLTSSSSSPRMDNPLQRSTSAVANGENKPFPGMPTSSDSLATTSTMVPPTTATPMRSDTASDPAIISFIPTSSSNNSMSSSGLPSMNAASNFLDTGAGFSTIPPGNASSLSGLPVLNSSLSSSSLLGAVDSPARSTPGRATPQGVAGKDSVVGASTSKQAPIEHMFTTSPAELTVHERFFVHLPIEQTDECRDACNQRAILLYGISGERDAAQQELQKIATQISRIWQKKINVEFFENSKEVRFKRRFSTDQIADCLSKFRCQTYYDQLVIAGWCVRNLIEMISDFLNCYSLLLPTSESVEIVCFMLATCQNYRGILSLAVELLSHLILLERFLSSFNNDCIPGTISCQMAYVIVGYLAENFYYFLHSDEAPTILNGLYRLVEKELRADGYPISAWARAIASFIFHAKNELLNANLCLPNQLLGILETFRRVFPKSGADRSPQELRHNPRLFTDLLQEPRRFYSYHDYKKHLPSIEDAHTQYSFVVNAFVVAKNAKRDYAQLVELSNICGHVSAEKSLAGMWCVAVQELCYGGITKNGFSHLISEINVNEATTRYSVSTFVFLLASKYSFSCHALFTRLLNNVLMPFIRTEQVNFNGSEMGLCLALEIIASVVCATDMPFVYNESETHNRFINGGPNATDASEGSPTEQANSGFMISAKDPLLRTADERALRIVQIRELDACIFQVLSAVCILTDAVKRKLNASSGTNHNLRHLLDVLKCSFLAMCEQEWVITRIFRICETADMESFNCNALKHNSVGQQLLRIALRRKSERLTKQQLMVCNGNSKKSLLDKLLSAMTLWNMRATYYDLRLMIKEVSPDGTQKHAPQQQAYMDALICEIGKCCRDLFLNGQTEDLTQPSQSISGFRFNQINCYWLISPLINVCPKPDNIPQSFSGQVTVKAKFLKEAASMLDTSNDNSVERLKQSARLLSQKPFLNLILTCTQGEELDNLIGSLLRHLQVIINKAKENPTLVHQSTFMLEREGLLLRLNLIGGIFDSLLIGASTSEPWAIAFFQLIFYEIISYEREREYFNMCYDMLATLVHGMMAASSPSTQGDSERRSESRARFPAYNSFVKKIRKELGDRSIPPDLNCLAQLLPIAKTASETNAWEAFSVNSPQKSAASSKTTIATQQYLGVRIDKQPQYVQRHLMRLFHHTHYVDVLSPGIIGQPTSNSVTPDIFLAAPAVESVNAELYMTPYAAPPAESPSCVDFDTTTVIAGATAENAELLSGTGGDDARVFDHKHQPQLPQQPNVSSFEQMDYTPHMQSQSGAANMPAGLLGNPSSGNTGRLFPPASHHQGQLFTNTMDKGGFVGGVQPTPFPPSTAGQMHGMPSGMPGIMMSSQQQQLHQQQLQQQQQPQQSQQQPGMMVMDTRTQPGIVPSMSNAAGSVGMVKSGSLAPSISTSASTTYMPSQQPPHMTAMSTQHQQQSTQIHPAMDPSMGRMFATPNPSGSGGPHHAGMRMDAVAGAAVEMQTQAVMAQAAAGFLPSDGTSRSGSSTPTMMSTNESPRTTGARGGRGRKNAAANTPANMAQTAQTRPSKRKKESKQQLQQQAPMMGGAGHGNMGEGLGGMPPGSMPPTGAAGGMSGGMVPHMGAGGPAAPMEMMGGNPPAGALQHMQHMARGGMINMSQQQHQQMLSWQQQQMLQRSKKQQMPPHLSSQHQQQQLLQQQQQQQQQQGMGSLPGGAGGRFPGDHVVMMGPAGMAQQHQPCLLPINSDPGRPGGAGGPGGGGMMSSASTGGELLGNIGTFNAAQGQQQPPQQQQAMAQSKHELYQKLMQKMNNK